MAMLASCMMDDYPLTLPHLLERAGSLFPRNEIVTRFADGTVHRYTYRDYYRRTHQLANALGRLGVRPGDRVATLAWNSYRHFELYYAAPCSGAVLHTLNLRLHADDLAYIANHAGDSVLFVDRSLLPIWEQFRDRCPGIRQVVVLPDDGPAPEGMLDYETLLAGESDHFLYPDIPERSAAAMCYTSGTTGKPKGVLYGHRSMVLHSMTVCMADNFGLSERDCALPVVPMFHANAWGIPHAAPLVGMKLVFPSRDLSPEVILDLAHNERATYLSGVPTIMSGVLDLLDGNPGRWDVSAVRAIPIGGSAAPPAMIEGFRKRHGLNVVHAWGMTETSPLATLSRLKRDAADLPEDQQLAVRAKQGYPIPWIEIQHRADDGTVLPRDGQTMGELEVRGPWVAARYFDDTEQAGRFTSDGWFKTGDIVTIDDEGYIAITDRSKDVIKSGGEWISTVALENALMAHPAVLEAAVFAGRHPRWDERPLAAIVLRPNASATKADLTTHLEGHFAKWWLPDDYLFLPEIPKTSVGKFQKARLREEHGDHLLHQAPAP